MPVELSHLLRPTLRRPGLLLAIVLPLAGGLGPAIAMFSLVSHLLFGSPGLPSADRVLIVTQRLPELGENPLPMSAAPYLTLSEAVKEGSLTQLGEVAAMRVGERTMTGRGKPKLVRIAAVTPSFFGLVDVEPRVGRMLVPADGAPIDSASTVYRDGSVAVLSHALWTSAFGADPDISGRSLRLDGEEFEIVGVMPEALRYPPEVQAWVPLRFGGLATQDYGGFYFQGFLRPAPGTPPARVEEGLERVAATLRPAVPAVTRDMELVTKTVREQMFGDSRTPSLLLLGLTLVVIAGVAVNGAQVLGAWAIERRGDLALHAAFGATRRRLAGFLVGEGVALSLAGWVLGVGLALVLLRVFSTAVPVPSLTLGEVALGPPILFLSLLFAAAAGLLLGFTPVLMLRRVALADCIDAGSNRQTATRRESRLLGLLLAVQLALALVLVSGGVAFLQSFRELNAIDLGFDPAGVVTVDLELPAENGSGPPLTQRIDRLVAELEALPGAEAAGAALRLPVLDSSGGTWFTLPGAAGAVRDTPTPSTLNVVTPGFFPALGVAPVAGRNFTRADRADAEPVVLVDEALAREHFGSQSPLGRFLVLTPWPDEPRRIVGVVPALRYGGLRNEPEAAVYVPGDQLPLARLRLVVKGRPGVALAVGAVQQRVWKVVPQVALDASGSYGGRLREETGSERWALRLVLLLACLGLLLCLTSVYGVATRLVSQRRRELGIRSALGCPPAWLVRFVVLRQVGVVALGVGAGLVAVWLGSRWVQSTFEQISPWQPGVIALTIATLVATVLLALVLPARRAAGVDPTEILAGTRKNG